RPQALPAHPIGCLPEHNQRSPYRLVIQRSSDAGLSLSGNWLGVQCPDRGLLVIAGHGNKLIQNLALLGTGRSAVAPPNNVRQFSPCCQRHLGSHSPSQLVEAPWWQAQLPVTSHLTQLAHLVTFLLRQCGGRDGDYEIYRIRPDGTELRRLTHLAGNDAHPSVSPDGEWIAFA